MTAPHAATRVVVAVLTYRREHLLLPLLAALQAQVAATPQHVDVRVLVVDNDPAGSGRAVVEEFSGGGPSTPVHYVNETTPGIAAARNRALVEAGDDDLMVFVDDDEVPHEAWLARLVACRQDTRADGVAGAVVSQFAVPPDPWVGAGEFFRRRRPVTGTQLRMAATNNLLLDMAAVRRTGVTFDVRYGLSGGSDTLFTKQLVAAGCRLVWCDEAVVTDLVPPERVTRRWVLTRAMRSGNGWSRITLEMASGPRRGLVRARLVGAGCLRVLGGSGRFAIGIPLRNLGHQAKGARTVARGAGMVAGATGYWYHEYRRATGLDVPP